MISIDDISKIAEKRNKLKKETYTKIYLWAPCEAPKGLSGNSVPQEPRRSSRDLGGGSDTPRPPPAARLDITVRVFYSNKKTL